MTKRVSTVAVAVSVGAVIISPVVVGGVPAVEPTSRVGDLAHHLPVRAHRGAVARQGRTCEIARLARPAVDRILAHILAVEGEQRRSEEHTSELQSLMRISYAVFCLKKKTT